LVVPALIVPALVVPAHLLSLLSGRYPVSSNLAGLWALLNAGL
jgi:hypothetical protein